MDTFLIYIKKVQPSQLYINIDKLESLNRLVSRKGFDSLEPVPVKFLDNRIIFTDGHTRAFLLHKLKRPFIKAFWDRDKLDWKAYGICVNWCLDIGITSVADMKNRLLCNKEYEQLWVTRCENMHADLLKANHRNL